MIQQMLAIWSLVPLPFLNPVCTSGSSHFVYGWSQAWRILSISLLACEMRDWTVVWAFFVIALLLDWNENWPFPVLGPLLGFHICWYIECSTLIAPPFRIWNSSAGIPPPPLALFIVMLPKVHLTSHSRISDSRWVITPSWLSRTLSFCVCRSSVYSCHLFLISSASVTASILNCAHVCTKWFSRYLQFSWRHLQSLPFYCFPLFLCTVHLRTHSYLSLLFSRTLHSVGYILPFLLCLSLLFFLS